MRSRSGVKRPGKQSPAGSGTEEPSIAQRLALADFLAGCRPFACLSTGVRQLLASCMQVRSFASGSALIRQGDPGDSLIVILDGRARVTVPLPDGRDHVLWIVGKGDIVGEMALLTDEPRNASVVALEDTCTLVLAAEAFERLILHHPEIRVVLTDILAARLGQAQIDGLHDKLLGGYRILECVGHGGMAVVYRAVHEESGRPVALKMMNHRLVYDSNALERFQREADIAESLECEHIIRVYGRFECYKTYFLAMEFCEGPTLEQIIELKAPLGIRQARRILGQLAKALAHLHARQLLHRDLKPSNVLVDQNGIVKLTDFGLARPALGAHLTTAGTIIGTPAYMSPEQLAGKELDSRVDAYALGCIAYEMLKGKRLFDETDLTSLIYQKLTWTLPDRRTIREDLSEDLYAFLRMALAGSPGDPCPAWADIEAWAGPVDCELVEDAMRLTNVLGAETTRIGETNP